MPWINHYGSNEFAAKVDSVIDLFDNMATNASSDTTEMMSEAYCKCSRLEYHFWDDAYNLSLL
jgi:thiaminase/transcriptional activator TenA